jgi:rpsU-divergently transcribed protein
MSAMDFTHIRDRLVLAALPHVAFDGWSPAALAAAARAEGLDPTMAERAFMAGPAAAVEHFADLGDRLMLEDLAGVDMAALRVPERIQRIVETRLARWAPQREAVRRGLAALALNPGAAVRATHRTVDAIWRAAGESSSDFSWYTRRATLGAVYSATVLYWLDDPSEDGTATGAFLKRRLADVGRITALRKRVGKWAAGLPGPTGRAVKRV